jgi:hypothetical protein
VLLVTHFTSQENATTLSHDGFIAREICRSIEDEAKVVVECIAEGECIVRTGELDWVANDAMAGSVTADETMAKLVFGDHVFLYRPKLEEDGRRSRPAGSRAM